MQSQVSTAPRPPGCLRIRRIRPTGHTRDARDARGTRENHRVHVDSPHAFHSTIPDSDSRMPPIRRPCSRRHPSANLHSQGAIRERLISEPSLRRSCLPRSGFSSADSTPLPTFIRRLLHRLRINRCIRLPDFFQKLRFSRTLRKLADPLVGLNDFAFEGHVGEGGYGRVRLMRPRGQYRTRFPIFVAVKSIQVRAFVGERASRLVNEMRVHNRVQSHDGVVTLYAVLTEGILYTRLVHLVMEYMSGGNLQMAMQNGVRPIPERTAIGITRQVAEVLNLMHARGYAHGDVKLDNIVMENELDLQCGRIPIVKVIDFGFSRRWDATRPATCVSSARGHSIGYTPPEVYTEVSYSPAAVDVFCLGVVMFRLVLGYNPFEESVREYVNQIRIEPVCVSVEQLAGLAEVTVEFIRCCMQKDPTKRPTANKALLSLQQLLPNL